MFKTFFLPCILAALSWWGTPLQPAHADTQGNIAWLDTGTGKALILVHAFPTDKALWAPQQQGLQRYFRVISLDLWGFGESAATDGSAVSIEDYADEVRQLMNQLGISKAVIGGESMGGYVALAFLRKYPDEVEGVILSNTQSVADSEATRSPRETIARDILEHGTRNLIDAYIANALSPHASAETTTFLRTMLERQKATGMASALRGMSLRADTSGVLANTTVPILIITGDEDRVIPPAQSTAMHQLAKNSRLVILPQAGHLSNLEQPERWNQAVLNMFAQG